MRNIKLKNILLNNILSLRVEDGPWLTQGEPLSLSVMFITEPQWEQNCIR